MDEKIKNFKDLKIWQKGIEIVEDTYTLTKRLPKDETFGLISQMKRAAISLPSNVAEGFKRFHNKEYRHFLYIALGSAAELETQCIIALKLKYVHSPDIANITEHLDHFSK